MSTTPTTAHHPVLTRHNLRVFALDLGFFLLLAVLPFLAHAAVKLLPHAHPHASSIVVEGPVLSHDVGPPARVGAHHGHRTTVAPAQS